MSTENESYKGHKAIHRPNCRLTHRHVHPPIPMTKAEVKDAVKNRGYRFCKNKKCSG
jgi:hypothetical protein